MEIIIFDHGRSVLERGMILRHTGAPVSPLRARLCNNKGEKILERGASNLVTF